jgi:hypothetical protein
LTRLGAPATVAENCLTEFPMNHQIAIISLILILILIVDVILIGDENRGPVMA